MKSIILKNKQGEELYPVSSSDLIAHGESSVREALNSKQNILVSGSDIKTINGESILGSGDISITIPIATQDTIGGVKVGTGLSIDAESGVLSATGGAATSVDWDSITSKPSTFTPSEHTHTTSDITDFPTFKTINEQTITGTGDIQIDTDKLNNLPEIQQYEYIPIITFTQMDDVYYTGAESPGQSIYQISIGTSTNTKPMIVGTLLVCYDGEQTSQVFTGIIFDMSSPSDSLGGYYVWTRTGNDGSWSSWVQKNKPQVIAITQTDYDSGGNPDPDILYIITE